tara:strand:+ start:1350 stop:2705 length:1356 start_codon:yes stop_codon:yes gene_type:complete
MNRVEKRTVITLSSILGVRMLGLFLILPILGLYANAIPYATPFTIGIALGIYGLTQAILQIPFGYFSDRIGRKPMLILGLILFTLGSIIAANATSIYAIILGRALQGSGAIASVALAFLSDVTREEERTRAVAILGMSIGFSFIIAFIVGPILDIVVGLSGIFWIAAILSTLAMLAVIVLLPEVSVNTSRQDIQPTWTDLFKGFWQIHLFAIDIGIFCLHMILAALFVFFPIFIVETFQSSSTEQWKIYGPVLFFAVLGMLPLLRLSMQKKYTFFVLRLGVAILFIALLMLAISPVSFTVIMIGLCLFFLGFTLLEALMPSMMSRLAPVGKKGSTIGVYNTFQFMGIFSGGIIGGWLYGVYGADGVFIFLACSGLAWLILILAVQKPNFLESRMIDLKKVPESEVSALLEKFQSIDGVREVILMPTEKIVHLRVEAEKFHDYDVNNAMVFD